MSSHDLRDVIEAADRAITAEDFDALMEFYADDAMLVIRPGLNASGKEQIRKAFVAIADHFDHDIRIAQGDMTILESDGTALVIAETVVTTGGRKGKETEIVRRATYVFRKSDGGKWLCVIDNSYGTDLLDAP